MQKRFLHSAVLVSMVLLFSGCAENIYYSDTRSLAAKHRLIAIIPPQVTHYNLKRTSEDAALGLQKRESLQIQQLMYSWMLEGKAENRIFVDVQKVMDTNDRLAAAGYFDGEELSRAQLCQILGVDAILGANYLRNVTVLDGESIATGILALGVSAAGGPILGRGPHGQGRKEGMVVALELYDQDTDITIWTYKQKGTGEIGATPVLLVNKMMKSAQKKMPYYHPRGSM